MPYDADHRVWLPACAASFSAGSAATATSPTAGGESRTGGGLAGDGGEVHEVQPFVRGRLGKAHGAVGPLCHVFLDFAPAAAPGGAAVGRLGGDRDRPLSGQRLAEAATGGWTG